MKKNKKVNYCNNKKINNNYQLTIFQRKCFKRSRNIINLTKLL